MSEKRQKNAAELRKLMNTHYGSMQHKHNKSHLHYDRHASNCNHQAQQVAYELIEGHSHWGEKSIQDARLRKTRTRFNKGNFH